MRRPPFKPRGKSINLAEIFAINEGPFDDVERQMNRSQSVARPAPAGGAAQRNRYSASTGRAQSDIDSAQSLVKREEAGASSGLRVSGDKATLGALMDALHEASSAIRENEDLADWAEKSYKVIAMGMRKGDSVTLPAFQETPDADSFNDDAGIGPDDEGSY